MADFELALKTHIRFDTVKGEVSTEDLYFIPLTTIYPDSEFCLDAMEKVVRKELADSEEESFVVKKTNKNKVATLKLEIIRHVITFKLNEIEEKEQALIAKEDRQKAIDEIKRRKDKGIESMGDEDLAKLASGN